MRAKLANWADVSDVALLKRPAQQRAMVARSLCIALLRETEHTGSTVQTGTPRIVDGTIVKEPGKTGSQWRILYSLKLPESDV